MKIPSALHRFISEFLPLPDALHMMLISPALNDILEEAQWNDGVTSFDSRWHPNFNDAYAIAAARRFKRLTSIDLLRGCNLTDKSVVAFAEGCPGLTSVNLSEFYNLTDGAVVALAKHCPGLTSVNLSMCWHLTDTSVVALAKHCAGLTSVDLSGCITDGSVVALAEKCRGLISVDLRGCPNLTVAAELALAEHCPGLTKVVLGACSNSLVTRLLWQEFEMENIMVTLLLKIENTIGFIDNRSTSYPEWPISRRINDIEQAIGIPTPPTPGTNADGEEHLDLSSHMDRIFRAADILRP